MDSLTQMLETRKDLQKYLFIRGFLLSNKKLDLSSFPFYGHWNSISIGQYFAYTHELQKVHIYEAGERKFFLFGHAYNPFTMEIDERVILSRIAESYGTENYWSRLAEITGVYVYGVLDGQNVEYLVDPSGMQSAYYGKIGSHFYLTSHSQIVGDLCNLEMSDDAKELIQYKWYHRVMGDYLPADMTQFSELKRIVPSICYSFNGTSVSHKRFWPTKDLEIVTDSTEYQQVIEEAADILRRNMELISWKWPKPYISLTGGIDSNTTFAAANGIYERFKAFSYVSAEKETIDADAAEKIAKRFGVERLLFNIPEDKKDIPDFEEFVQIIRHNNGYFINRNENEYRKRIYLIQHLDCDVEVKSWVSETIRAYWYKHYGRKSFPALSPKLFRNLYKVFLTNRKLAKKVDRLFEAYIRDFEYEAIPAAYPPADMHYNEVTWGSWGGPNISEMKMYSDITFIYNNRAFFDLMFRVPLEKRINDQHHLDMKKVLNRELYDMNIRVVNLKETNTRAFLLNCIFNLNCILPGIGKVSRTEK